MDVKVRSINLGVQKMQANATPLLTPPTPNVSTIANSAAEEHFGKLKRLERYESAEFTRELLRHVSAATKAAKMENLESHEQ
jgi:hypothetical protein